MGYELPTKTVDQVITYVKRQFGDESGVQVGNDDIIRWINAAEQEVISANQVLKAVATTSTVASQDEYTLGTGIDLQYINSIHVDGRKLPYKNFNEAEGYITLNDPDKTQVTRPEFWYEWAGTVYLYPIPDAVYPLKVYYHRVPVALTTTSDTLNVPDNYFNRIVEYCMAQAYELDDNLDAALAKSQQFQSNLVSQSFDENASSYDKYPMITVLDEDL